MQFRFQSHSLTTNRDRAKQNEIERQQNRRKKNTQAEEIQPHILRFYLISLAIYGFSVAVTAAAAAAATLLETQFVGFFLLLLLFLS